MLDVNGLQEKENPIQTLFFEQIDAAAVLL